MAALIKYYARCNHGISAIQCDICIDAKNQPISVTMIPCPLFNLFSYTYTECLIHADNCQCDGCGVYSISNTSFTRDKLKVKGDKHGSTQPST